MSIITVENLQKNFKIKTKDEGLKGSLRSLVSPSYKEIQAVNNISFNVDKGEVLAFIGPNGAGKSTTIKMLTGILHPTSGNINVLGLNPHVDRKKLSFNIGTVFGQKSQLWFHLPPLDSFNLLGHIYELDSSTLKKRINELVDIFEIADLMNVPVRKLSLGQRIRCEIAASILHNPDIIFLDEPTIGLDVVVKQKIRELILRLNKEEKTTIFLTSHDAGDIEQLCKRAIIINHGEIVLNEKIKTLKHDYLNQKEISVKYFNDIQTDHLDLDILKQKKNSLKIKVDTGKENIDEVLSMLIKQGHVQDITISDPPMEDVISHIYTRSKAGDSSEVTT